MGKVNFLKKIKKGFILAESLIVITLIGLTLFYLFIQFNQVFDNYEKNYNYNSVKGLYHADQIKKFLIKTNFSEIIIDLKDNLYVDISDCEFASEQLFCQSLFNDLKVSKIYFVNEDITSFINYAKNTNEIFSKDLISYLNYIKFNQSHDGFRLLIEYTNNEFCSVNFL